MSKLKYLQSLWFSGPQQYNTWWYLPILGLFATVGLPDSCKIQPIYWGIPRRYFFVASQLPGCILQGFFVFFSRSSLLLLTRHLPTTGLHEGHLAWPCCWEPPLRCVNWFAVPSHQYRCYCRTFHVAMSLPHGWAITENDWDAVSSSGCCWKLLAPGVMRITTSTPWGLAHWKGRLQYAGAQQTKKMVYSELNGEMPLFLLLKTLGSQQ